jgi:hypothetical protein
MPDETPVRLLGRTSMVVSEDRFGPASGRPSEARSDAVFRAPVLASMRTNSWVSGPVRTRYQKVGWSGSQAGVSWSRRTGGWAVTTEGTERHREKKKRIVERKLIV